MGSDIRTLQEQISKVQEIVLSLSGVTHVLLHDSRVSGAIPEYEALTSDGRTNIYLAQKNLLLLAEGELDSLNNQIRRQLRAYGNLKSQKNEPADIQEKSAQTKVPAGNPPTTLKISSLE